MQESPFNPRPPLDSRQPILANVITHFCIPSTHKADTGGWRFKVNVDCVFLQTSTAIAIPKQNPTPTLHFSSLLFLPRMPTAAFPSCTSPPGKSWGFTTCLLVDGTFLSLIQISLRANTAHLLKSGTFTVTWSLMSISVSCDLIF